MSTLLVERRGAVLHLINNNTAARNALSIDYSKGVVDALSKAAGDPSIAAVILSGADGFFCAGGDLNMLIKRREMAFEERLAAIDILHDLIRAIQNCPKPVIAAVDGGAAGAGASISLACDLIVAAKDAYFAVSYLRVGLTPDGGVTSFLAAFLPRQMINEILFFGDKIPVERLFQLGAINQISDAGEAVSAAQQMGERLENVGPEALSAVKDLAQAAFHNDLETQLDREAEAMAKAQAGAESGEGIGAFLQKRAAKFSKFRK